MQVDVLAFAAHPDDIELSCSGLLLKLKSNGYTTGIVDLTRGELGTRGSAEIRARESAEAAKILTLDIRDNAGLEDGNVHVDKASKNVVIEKIRQYKPKIILCPYWDDRHPDHENASQLVQEAGFLAGLTKIKTKSDAYRPKTIIFYFQHKVASLSFIVDISEQFETKMKAVKAYKSQFYDKKSAEPETLISRSNFLDYIEARAIYFGHQIGVKYGEPFLVKSAIKVNNIVELFA